MGPGVLIARLPGGGGGSHPAGTSAILRGGSHTSEEGGAGTASAAPAPRTAAITGAKAADPNDPVEPGTSAKDSCRCTGINDMFQT